MLHDICRPSSPPHSFEEVFTPEAVLCHPRCSAMQPASAQGHNAAAAPSPDHDLILNPEGMKNLIFNPEGKKMVPFFHVMISYRVDTELELAGKMFDRLLLNSFERIPEVGLSQWPEAFTHPEMHKPGHANVFLDKRCLKWGENWDLSDKGGGFVGALLKSLIFVPLLSWKVEFETNKDDPKSKKRFKGSVGEMVARFSGEGLNNFIDPNLVERPFCDSVDNVLLELILAMELHAHLKKAQKGASCMHPCLRMFPIAVDVIEDYYRHIKNQLPNYKSVQTYEKASTFLKLFDIHISESERKTVREVVSYFFELQMEKFTDFGEANFALDTVCDRIVAAVRDVVSKIDPQSLFESKPLCEELDAFLSKRNLSYMTRILATNNITSLRQLSFLTHQQAIYDLAKECSSISSKSAVAELTTLTSVIEESKHDEASCLLSVRLDRFIDRDASFMTVIKSSSGLLISAAQKSWLTLYFLLGIAMLVIGAMSVANNGPGGNTIFDFVASAFLFGVCLAAKLHSPKRAFLTYCCMWPAMAVAVAIGFCIDFMKNGSFSLDNATRCSSAGSQLQTSFHTCAVAQIMCGPSLNCFLILLNFYQALNRQDLAWTTYLVSVALYMVISIAFEVGVLGYSVLTQTQFVILFGVACIFALTEWMNHRARRKAREDVAEDEEMYQARWAALLKTSDEEYQRVQLKNLTKTLGEELKSAISVDVLQDCKDIDVLYARAEFINDAFQSLVSILIETGLSTVRHYDSSKPSPLRKDLETFFVEKDVDKILEHMKHHHQIGTAIQNIKEEDVSVKAAVQISEQKGQNPQLPGQPFNSDAVAVNIEGSAAAHGAQDRVQHIKEGDVSSEVALQPSDARLDSATKRSDGEAETNTTTAPAVLVRRGPVKLRRGPVKLPARAIAKSYRVYKSQVNRLTDIVRTSVDCNSFASINAVVQMLQQVGYVRPLVPKKLVDSAKQNRPSPGNSQNASSSVLARCFSTGSQTSIFSSEKQPQPYKDAPSGTILEILRVRNRFAMLKDEPHWSGGFRDLAFKVKVGFQESSRGAPQFVPVNRWGDSSVQTFVCELQIHHQEMLPDKILEFFLSSLSPDKAASQVSKHRAEEFHKRYVKMRDALAS